MLSNPSHNAIRMQSGCNSRMQEAPEYAWEKDKQRRGNLAMMQSGCNLRCNPFEPEALSGDEDKTSDDSSMSQFIALHGLG